MRNSVLLTVKQFTFLVTMTICVLLRDLNRCYVYFSVLYYSLNFVHMCLSCCVQTFCVQRACARTRGDFVSKHASGFQPTGVVVKAVLFFAFTLLLVYLPLGPEVPEVDWSEFFSSQSPSAWPTIHQPFTVSCLTLWSPGYWPQPIQRKEWDSGIFENLRGELLLFRRYYRFSLPELSRKIISQHVLWEPGWQLISVGHLLTYPGFSEARRTLFPRGRQCEISTLLAKEKS